jgi:hypothetical protein
MSLAATKIIVKGWRTLCLILIAGVAPIATAMNCTDMPSCVIDIRWPIAPQFHSAELVTHLFVIRVIPGQSVDPEAYMVIRVSENGAVVVDYSFPDGESLFAQIRAMSNEHLSREDIAGRLKTRTVRMADSRALRQQIHRLFTLRASLALAPSIYLDTTRYDISEITPMNTFMMSIHDSPIDRKNDILEWAKSFTRACRAGRFK